MTPDTRLPCGCVRGAFLCPTAEQLWNASSHAWRTGNYPEYARLRQEYEAHFHQPAHASDAPAQEA
jgi:hypothetical protein